MKRCARCGETKPEEDFHKDRHSKDGLRSYCRECHKEWKKEWYKRNPEKKSQYMRKRKYGLTPEDIARMLIEQGDACAICGEPFGTTPNTRLCVDHNHATGQVRGLLCSRCNLRLEGIEDPIYLERAIQYLDKYRQKETSYGYQHHPCHHDHAQA